MKNEKKDFMELLKQVELLDENTQGQLAGGFSSLPSSGDALDRNLINNIAGCPGPPNSNCRGGNCVSGCGGVDI